jgi:hypothetical protein
MTNHQGCELCSVDKDHLKRMLLCEIESRLGEIGGRYKYALVSLSALAAPRLPLKALTSGSLTAISVLYLLACR